MSIFEQGRPMISEATSYRSLMVDFGEDDSRFTNTVFRRPVPNRKEMDYVAVQMNAHWPKEGGRHVRFNEIPKRSEKVAVFSLISGIRDLLEQSLMAELDLVEIRTGCIKVTFRVCSPVTDSDLFSAWQLLKSNQDTYRVVDFSARIGMRRVI
jgi:hypothetical protein